MTSMSGGMTNAKALAMPYLRAARDAAVNLKLWEDREIMARTWSMEGRAGADALLAEATTEVREAARVLGNRLGLAYRAGHNAT